MKKIKYLIPLLVLISAIFSISIYYLNIDLIIQKFSQPHHITQNQLNTEQKYDSQDTTAIWRGEKNKSNPVSESLALIDQKKILGVTSQPKRIEVDLTNQKLYAYQGDQKIFEFPISSGLYDWTPRGIFNIWIKLKYTKMEGGNKALGTYYYLPNVPFTMYFSNAEIPAWRGFGIHGAYWHNKFGTPYSHGSINMKPEDAGQLYYWTTPELNDKNSIKATEDNPGTQIIIYGKYQG